MLAMKLGDSHPLVLASKWYERRLCQGASAHFTVTDAMRRVLLEDFDLKANVLPLHDRPPSQFQPLHSDARRAFLSSLDDTKDYAERILTGKSRLLVSSTSWTPDEDFSVLMEALSTYSAKATTTHPQLPEVLAIITGKGPEKEKYVLQIEKLKSEGKLEMVTVKTAWLSLDDYASLLASADLGVSLHTSSSGVDLPMKVVDMFGAGLPVLGWNKFEAWPELVVEGRNGLGFADANGMADKLISLFTPDNNLLSRLKDGALAEGKKRWDDEWDPIAGRLFELVCGEQK
jgi:beta-1,4-mannosyltransferase